MERTYDFVEFTGSSGISLALTEEQREKLLSSPMGKFAFAFLAVWKAVLILIIAFGVILALAGFGVLWFAMRQPDVYPWTAGVLAVLLLGFLLVWVAGGISMLARLRRPNQAAGVPSQKWKLRVTRTWIECTDIVMGVAESNVCRPEEVRTISVSQEGALVAQLTARSSQGQAEMVLTGPLEPSDAGWLQGALVQSLGLDDKSSRP